VGTLEPAILAGFLVSCHFGRQHTKIFFDRKRRNPNNILGFLQPFYLLHKKNKNSKDTIEGV